MAADQHNVSADVAPLPGFKTSADSFPSLTRKQRSVKSPQMSHIEAQLRKAHRQQAQQANHARLQAEEKDLDIAALRAIIADQREDLAAAQKTLGRAVCQVRDVQQAARAEVAALQSALSKAERDSTATKRQLTNTVAQYTAQLEAERIAAHTAQTQTSAITLALAAIAAEVLGGPDATVASVAQDSREAVQQGREPVVRSVQTWLGLDFQVDAQGHLASASGSPGSRKRPYHGDGARAVTALLAAVRNLVERRIEGTRSAEQLRAERDLVAAEAAAQLEVVARTDAALAGINRHIASLQEVHVCARASSPAEEVSTLPLYKRVQLLHGDITELARAIMAARTDSEVCEARVHELEFYSALQSKVVEDAYCREQMPAELALQPPGAEDVPNEAAEAQYSEDGGNGGARVGSAIHKMTDQARLDRLALEARVEALVSSQEGTD